MNFLSIDPGLTATGWALWSGQWLMNVGLARSAAKAPLNDRIQGIYEQILRDVGTLPKTRVCERMEVRGLKNKGNPQVLCDLNLLAGFLASEWVLPREWKPNLPKEVHQPRILATLTPAERRLVDALRPKSLVHNAIDAVGIGLNRLGRLTPTTRRIGE